MRTHLYNFLATVAAAALVSAAFAQSPAPSPKLFIAAGDVSGMIERAKAQRKPDQANYSQPLLQLAPYAANLEYRVPKLNANPTVHEKEAEMFYVVEGSGTLITGGKLRDEKRTNPTNLSGSAIDGGDSRHVAKGDFIIVPENTPHWFTGIESEALVLMSIHLPR